MPIDYSDYPPNWKTEIVPRIRERSGDKCEWCGILNKAWVIRFPKGHPLESRGYIYVTGSDDYCHGIAPIQITLTTAHLGAPLLSSCYMTETKPCSRCLEIKPLDEFSPAPRMALGRSSACKSCRNTANRRWYSNGGKEFSLAATRSWRARNPELVKEGHKAWVLAHPEQRREQQKQAYDRWKKANPAIVSLHRQVNKARSRSSSSDDAFSKDDWLVLCQEYDGRCACCRIRFDLTPDHIVPVVKGGCSHIENIQPLCLTCNMKKGTKIIFYKAKHDKMDSRDENLAHLCQKCHLNYDREDHIRNRKANREARLGIMSMDLEGQPMALGSGTLDPREQPETLKGDSL